MTKDTLARKGLISFTSAHHNPPPKEIKTGTQGRNLKAGTKIDAMEDAAYWLVPTAPLAPRTNHAAAGPQLAGPSHLSHQSGKCTTGLVTSQSVWDIFSTEIPSFKAALTCVKLTPN